jgi:cbb3-type cytochrome oxidase subunit 1
LGHNILGLWFTTLGIGVAYYIVPRASRKRIYNHNLSIIGFWTLVLFYPAVGAHHTLSGPMPNWLMSEATVFSILMVIPVFTAVYNIFKSSKINADLIHEKQILQFILVGVAVYAFVSLQGSFQALRFVSNYLHFSQWVPGHAMLAIGGGFTLIAFGGFYYCYPRIIGRYMKSQKLITWHFWLTLIGISSIFLGLTIAGLIQAANWANTIASMHWIDATVRVVKPEMYFTALGGATYIAGQIVFIVNLFQTGFKKETLDIEHIELLDNHREYVRELEELPSV